MDAIRSNLITHYGAVAAAKQPDGQISLNPSGKSALPARAILSRQEGRIAIVTDAGGDAVDAKASARNGVAGQALLVSDQPARRTNDAGAYGKTVWSWHPLLVSSCRWRQRSNRIE